MPDSTATQNSIYGGLVSARGLDLDQFESILTQVQAWTTEQAQR